MDLDEESAYRLHTEYLTVYGLAIRGLIQHHPIGTDRPNGSHSLLALTVSAIITDPIDFDNKCDGSLPLEDILHRDPSLIRLFQDIDRSKASPWALTNAYKNASETPRCRSISSLTLFSSTPREFCEFSNYKTR